MSEGETPRAAQRKIIQSDDYPMRVLAGAGTGKTFTMVRKIERLIQQGVSPDRILALTFTNKAADSMREKLVERVGPQGHDIEAYTYHAVCHDILQEYGYHADIDPSYDIATDADRFAIVDDVLDEMPYRFTNPDVYQDQEYATDAVDRLLRFIPVMKRNGIGPDDIDSYLPDPARLIELGELVEEIETTAEAEVRVSWRSPDAERLQGIRDGLQRVETVLAEERDALANSGMEGHVRDYLVLMLDTVQSLRTFLRHREGRIIDETDGYGDAFKLPAYLFGSYNGAPTGIPDCDFTLTGKLRSFIEECQQLSDLAHGYRAYERRLDEENLLDFNDLVLTTVNLLHDEQVTDWLGSEYSYIFCDEYQDTDTAQFELVDGLLSEEELFVVGDDDQAIYEWRGANIENIGRRLTEAFPQLTNRTLEENFRSRQPILDLANNALDQHPNRTSEKVLEAVDGAADATDGVVTITAEEDLEDEAEQITNAITRLITGETEHSPANGYAPGDIAILVRKKRHAEPIIESLTTAGIPYELGGDLAGQSPGVQTAIAVLKAVADPADEASLNRVLRMRYRLHERDLARLNTYPGDDDPGDEGTLQDALLELPLDSFEEPERVEEARNHFSELWDRRDAESLSTLYREMKSMLHLDWFLSDQERRDLRALEEVISDFDAGAVQPGISGDFIEFLEHHDTITETSTQSMEDQPETDAPAVSIMTVHKSKGLEFPVVVLPQLQADEWAPSARTHDTAEHVLTGGTPLDRDFAQQDADEARRLLHVGITRAEEVCIPVGRGEEAAIGDGEDESVPISAVAEVLPDDAPWPVEGVSFPVWQTIQSSLPPTAVDGTETLAQPIDIGGRTAAIESGKALSRTEAQTAVFDLAEAMLGGEFGEQVADTSVEDLSLGEPPEATLRRRHSYTSLDTLATCTRRHYLDYVVRAFEDPPSVGPGDGSAGQGVSQQSIGILFHETAESAIEHGEHTADAWKERAERIATVRGDSDVLPAVGDCIDRFFETAASAWEFLSAERSFELDIDGETVVGQIDALARRPDGELVVLDFKATTESRSLEEDLQLPLYLLACESIVEEPVDTAGYVYVGDLGPMVDLRTFSDAEMNAARQAIITRLDRASSSTFEEYTAGSHCEWCPHRSLPCSDDADLS